MSVKRAKEERRIVCRASPKYHNLFKGYMTMHELPMAEAMKDIMRQYFDNLPKQRVEAYMKVGAKGSNHY